MLTLAARQVSSHRPEPGSPGWLRRRNLLRAEIGCIAAFHLAVAVTIVLAPRSQVITPGTSAIFGTIPLPVWTVWFAATGSAAAAAVIRVTGLRLWLTWCGVFPLGVAWIVGFSFAVQAGRGNAIVALVWPFLLIWWLFTALRMHLGGTEAWWGGH